MSHYVPWCRIALGAGFWLVAVVRLIVYIRRGR